MDIYLSDKETGSVLQFPMLPEKIECQTKTRFQSYDIMNIGEVKLPLGEELTGYSWNAMLPGLLRGSQPYIKAKKDPKEIQSQLENFRTKGTLLQLLITETPINNDVYLESFDTTYSGGYGDTEYKVSFVAAKQLLIKSGASTNAPASKTAARTSAPKKTHTVVKGDSLWAIAQSSMGAGSKYPQLYEANIGTIDPRNKKYNMPKYTIYPGQVLTIP